MSLFGRKKTVKKPSPSVKQSVAKGDDKNIYAAIAAAVFMYYDELHDMENYSLTIKRIEKAYSPWSSKIYGLRKNPRY